MNHQKSFTSRIPVNTGKLELPSISQVHSRGPAEASWYSSHFTPRSVASSERLPGLPQLQAQASSSNSPSPRGGSFSGGSVNLGSASSITSYSSSVNGHTSGFKTPSPQQISQNLKENHGLNAHSQQDSPYSHHNTVQGYAYGGDSYSSMNAMQSYADVHPPHMSANPGHAPSSGPPSGLGHYYTGQQPPLLQPGPQSYPSTQGSYSQYGYSSGMASGPSGDSCIKSNE